MTSITNILKSLALGVILTSPTAFASDFFIDTTINDKVGDANGGWVYEIEKMDVQWASDDTITVAVHTNFVDYNNERSAGHGNGRIVLGDLLINTDGVNSDYNYAFILSDADRERTRYYDQSHWDNTGTFTEISSTIDSKEYHNNSSRVATGEVMAGNTVGTGVASDWTVDRQNTGANHDNYDVISFNFNVGGIAAFQTASQLAFSWAMSCANDIVADSLLVNRPDGSVTKVPEPTSILLMLSALVFMVNSRNKKAN